MCSMYYLDLDCRGIENGEQNPKRFRSMVITGGQYAITGNISTPQPMFAQFSSLWFS